MFRLFQKLFAALAVASFICSINVAGNGADAIEIDNVSSIRSADYGKMPVLFEQNKGQTDREVKFVSRGRGYTLFLNDSGAVFSLKSKYLESQDAETQIQGRNSRVGVRSDKLKMHFVGANTNPVITGDDEALTKTNYYIGKKRFENLTNYHKVNYKNLYSGIDAVFYGNAKNQLEYDFVVSPNADASQIGLKFDGTESISIDGSGNLVIKTENAELVQQKPFAYQDINGERIAIAVSYKLVDNQVSFEVGDYDNSQPLVIDPVLHYLTYIGGTAFEEVDNVAVDAQGNSFIAGATSSLDYPVPSSRSRTDSAVFVTKISADGSTILYNTFLDGSENDGTISFAGLVGNDIAVDASGNAYVAGQTSSGDFPISSNAYQRVRRCELQFFRCLIGEEVYVTKLSPTGTMVYSTYLGGRQFDFANGIAVDSAGKAYVTGGTSSGATFPKKNEFQGTGIFSSVNDAFLTVFNASGSDIVYSTGLGGNETDVGNAIALDASNNVYITGMTESTNGTFPTKTAFQANNNGGTDAFVAKFNTSLSNEASLIYSTLLGGSGTDQGNGIAVNSSNQAVVVGVTGSFNFPLLNAFRSTNQINEAFVTVLSSTGASLANSSFLGGADQEKANGVVLDSSGNIYVTGNTLSTNFPTALPFQAVRAGDRDAFVTKLKFGRGIISSSYLGGADFDTGKGIAVRGNQIFVVGATSSNNLATTDGVIKPTFGGVQDGFVAKILDTRLDSVGVFRPSTTFILTQSITNVVPVNATLTGNLAGARGVSGDFNGDGIDTTGSFTDGTWRVRDVNFPSIVAFARTFNFGLAGDLPVVGDWDGDGIDTAGTFRPSTGQFFLTNSTTAVAVNNTQQFGLAGDLPVAGDWDGDGIDTIGVFRPSVGQFFLTNSTDAAPTIDANFFFGNNGDLPFAGDFNGDGIDTISVWRPSTTEFFISNDNVNFLQPFLFGAATDQPIAGDWDGRPLP